MVTAKNEFCSEIARANEPGRQGEPLLSSASVFGGAASQATHALRGPICLPEPRPGTTQMSTSIARMNEELLCSQTLTACGTSN